MKRSIHFVAAVLIAGGIALPIGAQESEEAQSEEARELNQQYPLLSQLDIPTDSLPRGCTKPAALPDNFPLEGIRQCAITTDARAIDAIERRFIMVGAKNIEAMYYGGYVEENELGIMAWALTDSEVATKAYNNATEGDKFFKVWLHGKHVIALWGDTGTTDECMQQMVVLIDDIVRHPDRSPRP